MTRLIDTQVENTEIVASADANIFDTAHGGYVVKWMDETGVVSAMRFSGELCVTAAMRRIDFRRPIQVGDAAVIQAYVYDCGTTSIDVYVRVFSEKLTERARELSSESKFTYVAVDEDNRPTEVPELEVETEEGERLLERARET
ncbi:MAG: acyl-CoA thioesterase [Halobacteriota archaeon]